jgi:hypothetical protein
MNELTGGTLTLTLSLTNGEGRISSPRLAPKVFGVDGERIKVRGLVV